MVICGLACAIMASAVLSCSPAAKSLDKDSLIVYAKAKDLYEKGDFAAAFSALEQEKGAARFPPALVLKGKAAYFSGDAERAESAFKQALRARSSSTEALLYLARIARETGRDDEAKKRAESLLADDPSNVRTLRLAASLAADKGETGKAEALAFLDRAIEASSETALAFIERARLRWSSGNTAGALEDLSRARALSGENSPLARAVTRLEKTLIHPSEEQNSPQGDKP